MPLPVGGSVTYDWGDGTPSTTIPVEDAVDVHLYDRPGTYRVVSTVTDSSGKFYGSGSTTFKADHGALVVTSVTPDNGPAAGGTAVVLAGEGFTGLGKVRFEPNEAVFTVVSDSQVDATTPPGTGTVDILVWRQTDGENYRLDDGYTYGVTAPAPVLFSLMPDTSGIVATVTVYLNGENFTVDSLALVDGLPRPTMFISAATLTVEYQAADFATTVQFSVRNPDGQVSNELPFEVTQSSRAP